MATLALITTDSNLYDELVAMLGPSDWSVTWVESSEAATADNAQDVLVLDAAAPEIDAVLGRHAAPVLLVLRVGTETSPPSDQVDDVVFRGAAPEEWLMRLDRLEARARRSNLRERYAETFASMAPGIVVVGPELRMAFANPRAYEIVGHHEDTIGHNEIERIVAPEDWPRVRKTLQQEEFPRSTDIQLVRRDGAKIVCSASFARLIGVEGHTVISFEDVTDERQTERELLKTMQFLESLIDASVDAIIATDMERQVVLFNPSAERISGRLASDAVGSLTLEDLLGKTSEEMVMQRLLSEDYGGQGRLEPTMLELVDVQKSLVPVQMSASLIHEHGEPSAIVIIFTDLRDRIRVEKRLAEAQKQLAFTEKQGVLAELAGTAAHELNQPLTSMMAYAELLLRQSDAGSTGAKAAQVLIREAERMAEIVRKIGKITRYETTSYVGGQKIFDLDRAADTPTSDPGPER